MPLILDGDITRGWIRERTILKKLYEQTFINRSPIFKGYLNGVSKVTGLDRETVIRSQPARRFLKKLTG